VGYGKRPSILAAAQSECRVENPMASADTLGEVCPAQPGEPDGLVLRDLNAGTYSFVVALRRKLIAAGGFNLDADIVLKSLVLATTLEAERSRAR
jgi:hypothetical protein